MNGRKGFILLMVLVLTLAVMTMLIAITGGVHRAYRALVFERQRMLLRYYTEAGLSAAAYCATDPTWHSDDTGPSAEQRKLWLTTDGGPEGSRGLVYLFSESGGYKVVKIAGHHQVYSIGFIGASAEAARYKLVIMEEDGKRSIL